MVSGWQQALTLIIVLIPGFVYQGVKRHRVGPSLEDQDLSIRLLRALVTSVIFLVVYAIALGDFLADRFLESDPQQRYDDVWAVGLIVGGLVFFIPAVAGHVSAAYLTRKRYFSSADSMTFWETVRTTAEPDDNELSWGRALYSRDTDYSPIPTAWDFATQDIPVGSFVRVLLPDDTWLGGQADRGSYFTSYPEPRDLYVDRAWQLDNDGVFVRELPGPTGIWIPCSDAKLLHVTPPAEGEDTDADEEGAERSSWRDWWIIAASVGVAIFVHRTRVSRILERRRQR